MPLRAGSLQGGAASGSEPARCTIKSHRPAAPLWVPTEMYRYARGGHAFGLRRTKFPTTDWPKLAEVWLHTIGILRDGVSRGFAHPPIGYIRSWRQVARKKKTGKLFLAP